MADPEGDASLARRGKGFTVQASPFNAVKLDLAVIIIIAVVLLLINDRLFEYPPAQLALLAGYGMTAMMWIIVRTWRIAVRQTMLERSNAGDDNSSK